MRITAEDQRLIESERRQKHWQRWGPYLSERQWGTVREDYSEGGDATWSYFPHDHARSRAYRWGEDGLLGITDRKGRLCFSFALWNGRDPILKERLFGVTGPEGNHGEDVKECYYYLDSTPTHSYMKALYKYPHARYPYEDLVAQSRSRSRNEPEYELTDTGIFDESRYFDVLAEYAKDGPNDLLIRLTVTNRGPQPAVLHLVPQLFFRNTWTWQCTDEGCSLRPNLSLQGQSVRVMEETLGEFWFTSDCLGQSKAWSWLFTDNETNPHRHPGLPSESDYHKDAFHEYVIEGDTSKVNPANRGTKCASYGVDLIPGGESRTLRLRLTSISEPIAAETCDGKIEKFSAAAFGESFEAVFEDRIRECDEYYKTRIPNSIPECRHGVMRQAYAGLLWTKQYYYYAVNSWLDGDPNGVPVSPGRKHGRNSEWRHLFNRDVISMPDKWEYPWYAAWDLAFHMVPMSHLDTKFAKDQMILFLREWYMHPSGQIPAYEWHLEDVNPPVHAWGVWQVYKASGPPMQRDRSFLARAFQKLLLNFTWWVNRKDPRGRNIFSGGFLGLDNIGVFDRSKPLPNGHLEQADGTAWMAFYCGTMLRIAIELADESEAYGDMASKFFEHYVAIAEAMNTMDGTGLWDEEEGFYYDHLFVDGKSIPIRVRSLVGLLPLTTGVILEEKIIDKLPGFKRRMTWFLNSRPDLSTHMTYQEGESPDDETTVTRRLLAIPSEERFRQLLSVMLDESEFLSAYGIRSLSAAHSKEPFVFDFGGTRHEVRYVPGESDSGMFGGNSNWRGPIWFPMNYLIIQSLKRYHAFYGDTFKVECPTGSGNEMTLMEVAQEIESRCISMFECDENGVRAVHGGEARYADDPAWKDLILFYEYFHADNGRGMGASHQTGWTALVASMIRSQSDLPRHTPIATL
ncbi:MGH1-like glycoside hydrolase domain-containing protein [Rhodopirellula sp. MGV]|uniref:MGH1-like glycoside hydrolase domain-containing protein n=1 Tax=Rhodopirellula sp. MGV TaxID=2023130 RepID=UPI000B975D77|nr:glucosidase [Rhodopirellula sp. MGV]OYP38060.1 glucosidase [Rhodopirellula sp. MGV]PNY35229.1 glucosidase [Rhodopirellula baltica]